MSIRRRSFFLQALALAFMSVALEINKLSLLSNISPEKLFPKNQKNSSSESASKRPNVVLIIADDMRWNCLGIMGNRVIQTPNLDKLALEGSLFINNFVTTSICSSSRASILTGQYSRRHKIWDFESALTPEQWSLSYPDLLRKAGYKVGFIGKWGLGGELPSEKFDYWRGFEGHGEYFQPNRKKHLDRLLTEQALEFIDQVPEETPFCLCISYKSPHAQDGHPEPFQPDPQFATLYEDVSIPKIMTNTDLDFRNLPQFLQISEGRIRWQGRFDQTHFEHSVRQYYRLVTGIDYFVNQIIHLLKYKNIYDNTYLIFTSDNGFFLGDRGLSDKWFGYEESIRTPLIIRSPYQPSKQLISATTLNIDIAPTILDIAGVEIPKSMQGSSLLPLISGEKDTLRDEWFYEHLFEHPKIPKSEGIRNKNFKYLHYLVPENNNEMLFDLENDPLEQHNLAYLPKYKEQIEKYRQLVKKYEKEVT